MSGLGVRGERDLLRFVESAREGGVVLGVVERRGGRRIGLWWRGRGRIAGLPRHGAGATELDEIETDLRWAARLKAELVRSQLPLLVRVFEECAGAEAGGGAGGVAGAAGEQRDRGDRRGGGCV